MFITKKETCGLEQFFIMFLMHKPTWPHLGFLPNIGRGYSVELRLTPIQFRIVMFGSPMVFLLWVICLTEQNKMSVSSIQLIFPLVSDFFGSYGFFTSIVNSCWPFVLVFRASVPVFSPSFPSGFGGLFNRSCLLVLSLELSYIFSWSIRCFLSPLFLASIIALLSLFFVPCQFDCTSLYVLHVVICLPFDHAIFYFCVILVFVAWFLIMVLLLLPFLFFHCA